MLSDGKKKINLFPRQASTIATERFIGQSQAKTTHIQHTNQEPSYAEFLDRASNIEFNIEVLQDLGRQGLNVPYTSSRKKKISVLNCQGASIKETSNLGYISFRKSLINSFGNGGTSCRIQECLMISDNSWERPYWQTVKPEWIAVSQPAYDKIDTSLNYTE